MTITCIKEDKNAEKEFFTVGKSYFVLDYRAGEWILVSDNDNEDHYLSYQYAKEFFTDNSDNKEVIF